MGVTLGATEMAAATRAVTIALDEDLGPARVDLTAVALAGRDVEALLVARAGGVVCGLPIARMVFETLGVTGWDDGRVRDGAEVAPGDELAVVSGPASKVLAAERVALNFLQQLSGTASLTRRYVDAVAGTGARILDTRKTVPGLRALQRYAVRCGGGCNHRFGLYDVAMVKDNHVGAVGLAAAVDAIRAAHPERAVVVETRTLSEVQQAVAAAADVVLLDNMGPEMMADAVEIIGDASKAEASGGITLDNVREVAASGVGRISVGALTHSAPSLDIALDLRIQPG